MLRPSTRNEGRYLLVVRLYLSRLFYPVYQIATFLDPSHPYLPVFLLVEKIKGMARGSLEYMKTLFAVKALELN